jgi:hypothetical protein
MEKMKNEITYFEVVEVINDLLGKGSLHIGCAVFIDAVEHWAQYIYKPGFGEQVNVYKCIDVDHLKLRENKRIQKALLKYIKEESNQTRLLVLFEGGEQ